MSDQLDERIVDSSRYLMASEVRRVDSPSERARRRAALAPLRANGRQAGRAGYCPVIHSFLKAWSQDLSPAEDDALLVPLVDRLAGTRDPALEERRALMVLDWLVRVNMPAWRLAAKCAEKASSPESAWTLSAPEPAPEINCTGQMPAIAEALLALFANGWTNEPTDNWAYNYREADAEQAARNHFRMVVWRRSEAAIWASANRAAISAAYAALEHSQALDDVCWRAIDLARSAAARAASAEVWPGASRAVQGPIYAAKWAAMRARAREDISYRLWHTEAPYAWRQREFLSWLAFLSMASVGIVKALGWDFAASIARGIVVSIGKHRAERAFGSLKRTREALQRSAVVLVNNLIEVKP